MQILGIDDVEDEEYVLNAIAEYIFDIQNKKVSGSNKKKTFDLNYDYKYYFPDFLKYRVNLNKEDIDWWEFNQILDAIMIDETSNMHRVLKYRNYEKPIKNEKTRETIKHQQMMKLKQQYALPIKTEEGAEKLWNYLEKKVGEKERMKD